MPPVNEVDRRTVLRLIAVGAAASVSACSRPEEAIYPMADQPGAMAPGVTRRYATALPLAGYGRGVTGLVVGARPIKLEGLAAHPASLGATDLFTETAILDLYDPQRLRAPEGPNGPSDWPTLGRTMFDRIASNKGRGLGLLTGRVTSPTLLARIAALRALYPEMRHVAWEPFGGEPMSPAFGGGLVARPRFGEADVILTLGADPLGPGADQVAWARAWADRRRHGPPTRLYAVEPSLTATGAMADVRAAAGPSDMARFCRALAAILGGGEGVPDMPPELARMAKRAARDLLAAKGRALVLPGVGQNADVLAFARRANELLAAPIDWIEPFDPQANHPQGLSEMADAMRRGAYDTLIVIDANPIYAAPPDLRFGEAMAKVPFTVFAGSFANETGARATWCVPLSHPLEGWHDWRAPDGTASIAQPLVRPFYDSRTASEIVDMLGSPHGGPNSFARVRETWRALDDRAWRDAVSNGIVPDSAAPHQTPAAAPMTLPSSSPSSAFHAEIRVSPTLYDGRFSTNAWAQECPDPLTKEVWGASARMAAADMAALGVADGDLVRVAGAHGVVTQPARATRGQARGVVTLLTGYGRRGTGAVAEGIGANAWVLAGGDSAIGATPVTVAKADGRAPVTETQHHFELDGELAKLFPVLAPGERMPEPPLQPTLVPPHPPNRDAPPQWAMAIDTDVCIGCNACVVACQAENNVPVIGRDEIAVGRDMHWLRVDRYDVGEDATGFQPVPCMQCEKAPCEPVCPVEASVHDAQGLNVQVYNRCIGTRTCQANCPYKVRRFNFLDYAGSSVWNDAGDASVTAQRNPDVSVRARGVMEKCTYCVQRISAETHAADAEGRPVGQVVTACQAACPTRAITFGRIGEGAIAEARADPRHYALLEELGTRPRTTYLARRSNGGEA